MKKRSLFLTGIGVLLAASSLVGCGSKEKGPAITIWVGGESVKFYKKVCKEFFAEHPDYEFHASVKGVDTGTISGTITSDSQSAADIYTVAHDNIAKLVAAGAASPITDDTLKAQIDADNPQAFKDVIYSTEGSTSGEKALYGVPYISQALFLYYNKKVVSDEQAKTFEGLKAAAAAKNMKAFTVTGTDGYNFSFTLLARKESDKTSTLQLYPEGDRFGNYVQGDDEVAFLRWAHDMFADKNGGMWPSSNWVLDIQNNKCAALIGGAWHFDAFAASCDDFGIGLIPTFTLTSSQCEGLSDVHAGDVYRGGTFADCKVFMMNFHIAETKKQVAQELLTYLSSKEVQKRSFIECKNVPAFEGAAEYIESVKNEINEYTYKLGKAQTGMAVYGMAQPFIKGLYNTFYYSKGMPDYYKNSINANLNLRGIREVLYTMEYMYCMGLAVPDGAMPETLPQKVVNPNLQ